MTFSRFWGTLHHSTRQFELFPHSSDRIGNYQERTFYVSVNNHQLCPVAPVSWSVREKVSLCPSELAAVPAASISRDEGRCVALRQLLLVVTDTRQLWAVDGTGRVAYVPASLVHSHQGTPRVSSGVTRRQKPE